MPLSYLPDALASLYFPPFLLQGRMDGINRRAKNVKIYRIEINSRYSSGKNKKCDRRLDHE